MKKPNKKSDPPAFAGRLAGMDPQMPKPTKPSFSVRLDDNERAALDKAAKAEDRPAAYIVRRVLLAWLKAKGFLK
jgi:hypothetical protein